MPTTDPSTPQPRTVDLLIEAGWVVPVRPAAEALAGHAVAVDGGRIVDVLPSQEATRRYAPRQRESLPGHVLIPGLVNLHTHAAMALLRGYADDLPLMVWLKEKIWPAEGRFVGPEFVRDGTLLAAAEMLRGGITCFNDMYFHPEEAARAAAAVGMRAALGILAFEFPTRYGTDADDYLRKGLAVRDALRDDPLVSFCMAPHAPYTVADRTFERIATLAAQLDIPIHIHVHETTDEVADSVRQHGVRPLERLHRLGLLGPGLVAVHAVHLDAEEISLLAETGSAVAHCPTSNMKLGSGIAPVAALDARGVRIGLGTDGAASNNRLDLFHEMRHAALLAKAATGDAAALNAHRVLAMATLDGAAALGLDDRIGSIEPGKEADLCAVRLDEWLFGPVFDPVSHLVYVAGREQVSHVWVRGECRLRDTCLTGLSAERLIDTLAMWQNKLSS